MLCDASVLHVAFLYCRHDNFSKFSRFLGQCDFSRRDFQVLNYPLEGIGPYYSPGRCASFAA